MQNNANSKNFRNVKNSENLKIAKNSISKKKPIKKKTLKTSKNYTKLGKFMQNRPKLWIISQK